MDKYNIDEYDFREDGTFQAFFKSRLGDKFVPRDTFIRTLIKCKREYLDYLNDECLHNRKLY